MAKKSVRRKLLDPTTNTHLELLGADDDGHFVYAATRRAGPGTVVSNNLATGMFVLSISKTIFLHKIYTLIRLLREGAFELMYTDTDSCYFASSASDLKNAVEPALLDEWEAAQAELYEDPDSHVTQIGLWKKEGIYTRGAAFQAESRTDGWSHGVLFAAYIRNIKCYEMSGQCDSSGRPLSGQAPVVRMKSVPRKMHRFLTTQMFQQQPSSNDVNVRSTNMRCTAAGEMTLAREGKQLPMSLNLRRKFDVRRLAG